MKGTVKFFNNTKGMGFIVGEDGKQYFVHQSEIVTPTFKFRVLLPGWEVEFTPDKSKQGPTTKYVSPLEMSGITTPNARPAKLAGDKFATLNISEDGEIAMMDDEPVVPAVEAPPGLRAYFVGDKVINGFNFQLPIPGPERVILLLSPEKARREMALDGRYKYVPFGSYLLSARSGGRVTIWTLGRRFQEHGSERHNWVVVEERFSHLYDPSRGSVLEQTPTSGLARDNHQFVPAIEAAFAALESFSEEED